MTDPSKNILELDELPISDRVSIDRICSRYEQALQSGTKPCLEDYCLGVGPPTAGVLFRELLYLEWHYHRDTDRVSGPDDLRRRFPHHRSIIDQVWSEVEAESQSPPAPSTRARANDATGATTDRSSNDRSSPLPEIPGYEIEEKLGYGGMAVVYAARHLRLNRPVALKLVAMSDPNEEVVARVRTEAAAVAQLQHPNIIEIFDVGEYQGRPYLALEFAVNGNLARLNSAAPQSPRRAAQMIETLARAVDYAHRRGIVHRDLKPTNILLAGEPLERINDVSSDAELPLLKIADFGLAKFAAEETGQTRSGMLLGTPSYMAPEQAAGQWSECGPSVDIYALGAILYELLTGRAPFKAATVLETVQLVQQQPPPSLRQFQPHLPRDLETICHKCLAKTPTKRYDSALALAEDLRRFLNYEPIHARAAGWSERTWRWARRHPAAATGLAAVSMGLLCVLTLVAALFHSNRQLEGSVAELRMANSREGRLRQLAEEGQRKAETAESRERDARQQVERVLQTLVDSFRSPDPARDGRTITVVEILDRAVEQLHVDAAEHPEHAAALWNAIGRTYHKLGLPLRALEVLEPCLQHCETHLGVEHKLTLAVRSHLAAALQDAGNLDLAIQQYEQTLDRLVTIVGPQHPDTLASINNLAHGYQAAGLFETAARLHEQVLDAAQETLGERDPRTLSSMNNLAWVYDRLGRVDEAIALHQRAIATAVELLGPDDPQTLAMKNNLALAYHSAGRLEASAEMLEQVLAAARRRLGDDHPNTLSTMNSLVRVYRDSERFDRVETLLTTIAELQQNKWGPDHPDTRKAEAALRSFYRSQDD